MPAFSGRARPLSGHWHTAISLRGGRSPLFIYAADARGCFGHRTFDFHDVIHFAADAISSTILRTAASAKSATASVSREIDAHRTQLARRWHRSMRNNALRWRCTPIPPAIYHRRSFSAASPHTGEKPEVSGSGDARKEIYRRHACVARIFSLF